MRNYSQLVQPVLLKEVLMKRKVIKRTGIEGDYMHIPEEAENPSGWEDAKEKNTAVCGDPQYCDDWIFKHLPAEKSEKKP
jgi:hypothetical protein